MAQLPKIQDIRKKHILNKDGFLFCVLSGYGIKDWHINLLVLMFFVFFFFNLSMLNMSVIGIYQLSKIIGLLVGLSFFTLVFINRYLLLSSAFWQPRLVLLMFVPIYLFIFMGLNYVVHLKDKTEMMRVERWSHNSMYLKNADGSALTGIQERMYKYHPDDIIGVIDDLEPIYIEIHQHMGLFGIWMVDSEYAIYEDDFPK